MDLSTIIHLAIGLLGAILSGHAWWTGGPGWVSGAVVFSLNVYQFAVLLEASRRAGQDRTISNGIVQAKPWVMFEFPQLGWSIAQVVLLLFIVVCGFANMYLQEGGVIYNGPPLKAAQEVLDEKLKCDHPPLADRLDAAYFSMVTITTLGYGDFVPTTEWSRKLVMWELGTGLELLVGIFSLLVARIADF